MVSTREGEHWQTALFLGILTKVFSYLHTQLFSNLLTQKFSDLLPYLPVSLWLTMTSSAMWSSLFFLFVLHSQTHCLIIFPFPSFSRSPSYWTVLYFWALPLYSSITINQGLPWSSLFASAPRLSYLKAVYPSILTHSLQTPCLLPRPPMLTPSSICTAKVLIL